MLDYLVVGLGLAGISFCEQLERHGKSYHVVSDHSQISSLVAGGLYNPVILKRFTLAWRANEQLEIAKSFYHALEDKLGVTLDYPLPIVRRFNSAEEQNLWFEAMDKPYLKEFLSTDIQSNENPHIYAPFGFGRVLRTGRIATAELITQYSEYLSKRNRLSKNKFDYQALRLESATVAYKSLKAKRIVFAEGFGLKKNPFFNYLPLTGTKGEYLIIKAPALKESNAMKSSIFVIPEGNDLYRVGATYKSKDNTNLPTVATKEELQQKLETFIRCDYEIVDQVAGIRPTVTDRRPLVGQHPEYKNAYVLNGFGSRGVMIAPYASEQLYGYIKEENPLDTKMNIRRFDKMSKKLSK